MSTNPALDKLDAIKSALDSLPEKLSTILAERTQGRTTRRGGGLSAKRGMPKPPRLLSMLKPVKRPRLKEQPRPLKAPKPPRFGPPPTPPKLKPIRTFRPIVKRDQSGRSTGIDIDRTLDPEKHEADVYGSAYDALGSSLPTISGLPIIGKLAQRTYAMMGQARGIYKAFKHLRDTLAKAAEQHEKVFEDPNEPALKEFRLETAVYHHVLGKKQQKYADDLKEHHEENKARRKAVRVSNQEKTNEYNEKRKYRDEENRNRKAENNRRMADYYDRYPHMKPGWRPEDEPEILVGMDREPITAPEGPGGRPGGGVDGGGGGGGGRSEEEVAGDPVKSALDKLTRKLEKRRYKNYREAIEEATDSGDTPPGMAGSGPAPFIIPSQSGDDGGDSDTTLSSGSGSESPLSDQAIIALKEVIQEWIEVMKKDSKHGKESMESAVRDPAGYLAGHGKDLMASLQHVVNEKDKTKAGGDTMMKVIEMVGVFAKLLAAA